MLNVYKKGRKYREMYCRAEIGGEMRRRYNIENIALVIVYSTTN